MPEKEQWLICYDENDIYFTDKASLVKGVFLPRDIKEMYFDTEQEMHDALNSELFAHYYEED